MELKNIYELFNDTEKFKELKSRINEFKSNIDFITDLNSNIKIIFNKDNTVKVENHYKFNDKEIKNNNIKILKKSILSFLTPLNNEKLKNEILDPVRKKELKIKEQSEKFVSNITSKKITNISFKEPEIFTEDKEENYINISSIWQPSFGLIEKLLTFKIIDNIEIIFYLSDIVEERNKKCITILDGVERKKERDEFLKDVAFKSKLNAIYKLDNSLPLYNISIKINFIEEVIEYEKIVLMAFLKENGLYIENKTIINPVPITNLDLIFLLSKKNQN